MSYFLSAPRFSKHINIDSLQVLKLKERYKYIYIYAVQTFTDWRRSCCSRLYPGGVGVGVGLEGLVLTGLVMARWFLKDSRCYCTQTHDNSALSPGLL